MKTIVFILSLMIIGFQGMAGSAAMDTVTTDEAATAAYKAKHGQLNVHVDGLTSETGTLKVLLFNHEEGFPLQEWSAMYAVDIDVETEGSSVVFESIPYGDYAIYIYHDENGNGKFDKSWSGAAKESFGYSNMETGKRVMPLYSQSVFPFEKDGSQLIIEMMQRK